MSDRNQLFKKWIEFAKEDLLAAQVVSKNGLNLQAAFHVQQAIEKTLIGWIIKLTDTEPPYSHDLVRLVNILKPHFVLTDNLLQKLASINPYYIQARYPSYKAQMAKGLSAEKTQNLILLAEEILSWQEPKMK